MVENTWHNAPIFRLFLTTLTRSQILNDFVQVSRKKTQKKYQSHKNWQSGKNISTITSDARLSYRLVGGSRYLAADWTIFVIKCCSNRPRKKLHISVSAMPLRSEISSRNTFNALTPTDERRRIGRYVAGGTALAVTLLGLHHVLQRGAFTIAGVCIPTIIMASYIIWVLYSARRDRRKALRLATVTQLTEVIVPPRTNERRAVREDPKSEGENLRKNSLNLDKSRGHRENPAFSDMDEV
ncbi:PREDICTED: uncharacterized protein LOC106746522 [Dinoponera quadriceps]|uniref:Uncharacterized protein LOC106746522 n=1 Tax=Dinoponera quadriceps TaxID=609295 RepID=A0A6P3XL24_DINQU|nr:PREDICTED: uncharacterized protein LOC106746522 [Dinoponera quadriceps]